MATKKIDSEFELLNSQMEEAGITKDDFVLVGNEKKVKEQKAKLYC